MIGIETERFSQIVPRPVAWIWKPWFAIGKLTILDGDPGVGKSLLTIDLAARLSRGEAMPDGAPLKGRGITAFLAAEDDAADTLRPRAEAAGANLDRLFIFSAKEGGRLLIPDNLHRLGQHLEFNRVDLLVIDPISAFLPRSVAMSSDQSIREVLMEVSKCAVQFGFAVLMVRHLRKASSHNSLQRGSGTMSFIASCRTGLLAAKDPTDPARGVLAHTKSNLGEFPPSLGYRIVTKKPGRQVWFNFSDRKTRSERHYWATLHYIVRNPVKHGYVENADEWAWSCVHELLATHGPEWKRARAAIRTTACRAG